MLRLVLIFLFSVVYMCSSLAENPNKSYYKINIKSEIDGTTWLYIKNGMDIAQAKKVDAIFLHLNTYGGLVVFADSIRTKILNSKIPVYVFIVNNAASAGALISISFASIYFRSCANIGAATFVVNSVDKMPDQSQ